MSTSPHHDPDDFVDPDAHLDAPGGAPPVAPRPPPSPLGGDGTMPEPGPVPDRPAPAGERVPPAPPIPNGRPFGGADPDGYADPDDFEDPDAHLDDRGPPKPTAPVEPPIPLGGAPLPDGTGPVPHPPPREPDPVRPTAPPIGGGPVPNGPPPLGGPGPMPGGTGPPNGGPRPVPRDPPAEPRPADPPPAAPASPSDLDGKRVLSPQEFHSAVIRWTRRTLTLGIGVGVVGVTLGPLFAVGLVGLAAVRYGGPVAMTALTRRVYDAHMKRRDAAQPGKGRAPGRRSRVASRSLVTIGAAIGIGGAALASLPLLGAALAVAGTGAGVAAVARRAERRAERAGTAPEHGPVRGHGSRGPENERTRRTETVCAAVREGQFDEVVGYRNVDGWSLDPDPAALGTLADMHERVPLLAAADSDATARLVTLGASPEAILRDPRAPDGAPINVVELARRADETLGTGEHTGRLREGAGKSLLLLTHPGDDDQAVSDETITNLATVAVDRQLPEVLIALGPRIEELEVATPDGGAEPLAQHLARRWAATAPPPAWSRTGEEEARIGVAALVDAGADPALPDANGHTLADHARARGATAFASALDARTRRVAPDAAAPEAGTLSYEDLIRRLGGDPTAARATARPTATRRAKPREPSGPER